MTERIFNIEQSVKNQIEYISKSGDPFFAPNNGYCYHCGRNIYSRIDYMSLNRSWITGVDVEEAKKLVTGCPHCHHSYCE